MRTPTAAELLDLWERASPASDAVRAELLLAALGEQDAASASLPLGRRDALLMERHARLLGARVEGLATCPACDAQVELEFSLAALEHEVPPAAVERVLVQQDGCEIEARLLTGADLSAAAQAADI